MDARITALNARLAVMQASRTPEAAEAGDMSLRDVKLRSSLHELAAAHNVTVSAIKKRLDRIEAMVGISTDMVSNKHIHRRARAASRLVPRIDRQAAATPDRGYIFDVKPPTPPLRLSGLRD
jgi:hypothetical protein